MKKGDEYSLMAALANAGPIDVGVDASSKAFRVSLKEFEVFKCFGTDDFFLCWIVMFSISPNCHQACYQYYSENIL